MADPKKQRRIQWGVNAVILAATLAFLILSFFIPGLQIVATVIGLSVVFAPLIMFGIGLITAVLWNAAFVLLSGLSSHNERSKMARIEGKSLAQTPAFPSITEQTPTFLATSEQTPTSPTSTPEQMPAHSGTSALLTESNSSPIFVAPKDHNPKVLKLATHVVRGEQAEAEAMIKEDPRLLLEKCQVVDYSGRTLEGTALQLALGAEDVKFHDKEVCMTEMIIPYLTALPNGENHKATQILEQFPEDWEKQESAWSQNYLKELNKVVEGIRKSNTDEEARPFIDDWENYLAKQKEGITKSGKHFNMKLLLKTLEVYQSTYKEFGERGDNAPKNALFYHKVIGKVLCYLPANYAQAFCTRLHDIVNGIFLTRTVSYHQHYDANIVFYPLGIQMDGNAKCQLGENFSIVGARRGDDFFRHRSLAQTMGYLKTISDKKQERILDLCTASRKSIEQSMQPT